MAVRSPHDVFALPYRDGYLIYAPLAGRIAFANAACAGELQRFLDTGDSRWVNPAMASRLGGLEWLSATPAPVSLPIDRHYHPNSVTLFLTNRCNLRCKYCYAQAGDFPPVEMSPAIYRAAIDLVVANSKRAGLAPRIGFHGGGEPTMAWEALQDAVEYTRKVARQAGAGQPQFSIATNGVMTPAKRTYVAANFSSVTLSMDGPPRAHNQMRPCVDGSGSFDSVIQFVGTLKNHRTPFGIRSTITYQNVRRMKMMVDFFLDHVGCQILHFEPVFPEGRGLAMAQPVLQPALFAREFVRALQRAHERHAKLFFSAARLNGPLLAFCGCAQDPFSVTPAGDVTACFEVCDAHNPLSHTYFFGHFNGETRGFDVDFARLSMLRSMTVTNKPVCARCFAKWTCCGDCPVKTQHPFAAEAESPRCAMIQTITRAMLELCLERSLSKSTPTRV
jgi:uncharacterized protein